MKQNQHRKTKIKLICEPCFLIKFIRVDIFEKLKKDN